MAHTFGLIVSISLAGAMIFVVCGVLSAVLTPREKPRPGDPDYLAPFVRDPNWRHPLYWWTCRTIARVIYSR